MNELLGGDDNSGLDGILCFPVLVEGEAYDANKNKNFRANDAGKNSSNNRS